MKHATRINALARQVGGIALNVAHGVAISASLMGMAYVANAGEGPTRVQFSDTFVETAVEPTVSELAMASGLGLRVTPPMSLPVVDVEQLYTPPVTLAPAPKPAPAPALKLAKPVV